MEKQEGSSKLPFGLQVREERIRRGVTQGQLAYELGTTKATISKLERSTSLPSVEWIDKLSEFFEKDMLSGARRYPLGVTESSSTMVPVIGMIAAGNWREAIQSANQFIPTVETAQGTFALRVAGDSLDQIAPEGSFVVIDPKQQSLLNGNVYAVMNEDGEATLKVFRSEPARLEPASSNKDHKPIVLGLSPISVVGRAVSVVRTL